MRRIRRILHPTDFSPASSPALKRAIEMAKANKAELLLVHVMTSSLPIATDAYVSPKLYEDLEAATRGESQKSLDRLMQKAKKAGVRVKGLLLEGLAHRRITQVARSRRVDLVVIGTHGRTGFAKLLLGSVASRVVTVSPCPVLTVKAK